jgi:resuscitation-promoting factor RpfA
MNDDDLDVLVARADLDGLVRLVDARCETRDWEGLLRLRDRARAAVSTGRQLWPAATLAEYRLALHADPPWVAAVLDEESGRFTIGPLTEVAAQHHTFASLRPHLAHGPRAAFVAHERVLRGETVQDPEDLVDALELPFVLHPWEPDYCVAEYSDEGVAAPAPPLPDAVATTLPQRRVPVPDPDVELAVRQLVEPWTASSNGHAEVVCVEGDAETAIAALGLRSARIAPQSPADGLRWLAWAGASGGAMARRRGGAAGRFGAWWTVGALVGLTPDDGHQSWPPDPDELGEAVAELRWYWWHADEPVAGWELQLAIEDPLDGLAWAINARDDA